MNTWDNWYPKGDQHDILMASKYAQEANCRTGNTGHGFCQCIKIRELISRMVYTVHSSGNHRTWESNSIKQKQNIFSIYKVHWSCD